MNPLPLILAAARSGAHKSGVFSAAEAIPGAHAAYVAILLAKRSGSELSSEEILAVYMAGPAISSYVLGILRQLVVDALRTYREVTDAFQRGTSEPTESPKVKG